MKKLALILAILIALSCPISAWAAADTAGFYDSVLSGIGSGALSNESADTINAGAFSDGSGILSAWGDEPAAEEPAAEEPADSSADYEYILLTDGTAEITGYTGTDARITIPAQLDGHRVTSIGADAFEECAILTEVTIPEGVVNIGSGAFTWCEGLTTVMIPASVVSMGSNPFVGCGSLKGVYVDAQSPRFTVMDGALIDETQQKLIFYPRALGSKQYAIPEGVTAIGNYAFFGCDTLTDITIPSSMREIGYSAFGCCYGLTEFTIPAGVTTIENYAFAWCESMTVVTIPASVTAIGEEMFWECGTITLRVDAGSYAEEFARAKGMPYEIMEVVLVGEYSAGDYKYNLYSDGTAEISSYTGKATELSIPAELDGHPVTAIGDKAFYWNKSLTSITIPDSVTSIGGEAFYYCESLTTITIPDSVVELGVNPFAVCESLTKIIVSSNHPTLATIDGVLFDKTEKKLICYPCAFDAESYAIPQGILAIGDSAFYDCDSLTTITIPDSVTSIGDKAFYRCRSLTSITIPDSVTEIGDEAFNFCLRLTLQVESGSYAEQYAKENGIACATAAPAAVERKRIYEKRNGDYTYKIYNDGTAEISDYVGSAKELVIPAELDGYPVIGIGDKAFYNCDSLTAITIPDSVTSIGDSAFYGCDSLTTITIPNSVTSIGDEAFYNCGSLTAITIPNSVTSIGDWAFYNCDSLTAITIPDSVTSIVGNPFRGCDALTKINVSSKHPTLATIDGVLFVKTEKKLVCYPMGYTAERYVVPQGITTIGAGAFAGCVSLYVVEFPDSVTRIESGAFWDCEGLQAVNLTDNIQFIGSSAFKDCVNLKSTNGTDGVVISKITPREDVQGIYGHYPSIRNEDEEEDEKRMQAFSSAEGTVIGAYAFYECDSLTEIYIPKDISVIGKAAFWCCDSLKQVILPDGLVAIGGCAFEWCKSLEKLTMPSTLQYIGKGAFRKCDLLTLQVEAGTCAAHYAIDYDIPYKNIENTDWLNV